MTVRLTRLTPGATDTERHGFADDFNAALDREGVKPGETFFVVAPGRAVPRARRGDPATSHSAAASVAELRDSQRAVLDLFAEAGNMTDEDLVGRYPGTTGGPTQSESGLRTRRRELADAGLLVDTDDRRRLKSGRLAIVWGVAPGPDDPEPDPEPDPDDPEDLALFE